MVRDKELVNYFAIVATKMMMMMLIGLGSLLFLSSFAAQVTGFTVLKRPAPVIAEIVADPRGHALHSPIISMTKRLYEPAMEVYKSSENEAVSLGVREWPQQYRTGSWPQTTAKCLAISFWMELEL